MDGGSAFAAAVLCGGLSTRMGADKASLVLEGSSLLDRAVDRLLDVADPVIIASGATLLTRANCLTVRDGQPGRGPLGGIVAALDASPQPLLGVVAVDMPDFDTALLQRLATLCVECDAVVPMTDRGPEPLHAVYATSSLPALREALASSDRALRTALHRLNVRYMDAAALGAGPGFADNLNTPGDVAAWASHVS
ncbi:MAG: molybdenum cofactor guanylyltransferase [Candidatus Dormibacteria bacterium]